MPTISMFYGILIRMFFRDVEKHHTPHIHAEYQGDFAVYSILDGSILAGRLPQKKHKLVVAWLEIHRSIGSWPPMVKLHFQSKDSINENS
jgi:hypothetical protein